MWEPSCEHFKIVLSFTNMQIIDLNVKVSRSINIESYNIVLEIEFFVPLLL